MAALISVVLFVVGVLLAVWATERLLEGLVSLSVALRLSAFAVGAVLSGFEAENIAVGLPRVIEERPRCAWYRLRRCDISRLRRAGHRRTTFPTHGEIAARFSARFCRQPYTRGSQPLCAHHAALDRACSITGLCCRHRVFWYEPRATKPFSHRKRWQQAGEKQRPLWVAIALTLIGIIVIGVGGELVAFGAEGIVASLGVPALLMGMVVSPAADELEEVIRQAVPSREGRHDVSAGNLVGTLLYFVLFNLGLIALITPVQVDPLVRQLDWPFLIAVTLLATIFLWRGRVGRVAGVLLLAAYVVYIVLHVILR